MPVAGPVAPALGDARQQLSHLQFLCGFLGGGAARLAVIPVELFMSDTVIDPFTRAFLARHDASKWTVGLHSSFRLATFHGAQFMFAGALNAVLFPDEQPGRKPDPKQEAPSVVQYVLSHFLCGALGTLPAALLCAPFDAVDYRLVFRHKSFSGALLNIWQEEGPRGFYRRSPSVLGTSLVYGAIFAAQATVRVPLLHGKEPLPPVAAHAVAGLLAGAGVHLLAFPFRRRLLRKAYGLTTPGVSWPHGSWTFGSLRASVGCATLFGVHRFVYEALYADELPQTPAPIGQTPPRFTSF
eukprot:EG_transcript_18349